jgi:glucose-6-phosphate isomerase
MFRGEKINITEMRAALRVTLRAAKPQPPNSAFLRVDSPHPGQTHYVGSIR